MILVAGVGAPRLRKWRSRDEGRLKNVTPTHKMGLELLQVEEGTGKKQKERPVERSAGVHQMTTETMPEWFASCPLTLALRFHFHIQAGHRSRIDDIDAERM